MNDDHGPTHLDLFSGIGGFALAAKWAGFRTVAFVELDKYCQKVLAKNFGCLGERAAAGFLCGSNLADTERSRKLQPQGTEQEQRGRIGYGGPEIHANIFDLDGTAYRGVSLITGGFPCQPFSVAGKRRGAADDRAIWPQMFRVISEARPAWVLGENVPGIIPMELDNVLSDLEGIGYATRAFVIPACAVDARHRRDRLWIVCSRLADPQGIGSQEGEQWQVPSGQDREWPGERRLANKGCFDTGREWLPEPDVGRVAHGVSKRVDRLKGLGNSIVPQVAYEILSALRAA